MNKKSGYYPAIALLALVGLGVWHYWQTPHNAATRSSGPDEENLAALGDATADSREGEQATLTEEAENGEENTEVDGDFLVDADGHLIVTEDVRHIFDYFLSMGAADQKEKTREHLTQYIENNLTDPARTEAMQLFDRYLQLKAAMNEANAETSATDWLHSGDLSAVNNHLQIAKQIRRRFFSEDEMNAFFGVEEAYDDFSLQRLAILQNKNLSDTEKYQQIQRLRDQLPDALQQTIVPQLEQDLEEKTQQLRNAGASENDIHKLREEMVGEEAAKRLEALDKEQREWNDRLEVFRAEKKKIVENNALSAEVKEKMIEALLEAKFSELERQRIDALEGE